jgi:hypothetical protein
MIRVFCTSTAAAVVLTLAVSSLPGPDPAEGSHPCSGPPLIFGDWTDDDRVDQQDVDLNLRYIVDPGPLFTHTACGPYDVNCDSAVDGVDVLGLLAYMAEIRDEEGPDCPAVGSDTLR